MSTFIIPQKEAKYFYVELFINLFNPGIIKIIENNTTIETYHTYENRSMNAGFTVRKYACFY